MLKMVDGTGIIGVDMVCPLGGTVSPPQPPNYDKVEVEGVGSLVLANSLKAPLERVQLLGNSVQGENPAPDNPQEIKSAGRKSKNLFNAEALIVGQVRTDGTINEKAIFYRSVILDVPEDAKYRITFKTNTDYDMLYFTDAYINGVYSNPYVKVYGVNSNSLIALKKGENILSFKATKDDATIDFPKDHNIMIAAESASLVYEPYSDKYLLDVKVTGKNIFNKNAVKQGYEFGAMTSDVETVKQGWFVSDFMPVKATTYQISGKKTGSGCKLYSKDKVFVKNIQAPFGGIKFDEGIAYFRINGEIKDLDKVQVEEGNQTTDYEPYQESQTLTLVSDRPITKWDKLVEQGGEYGWLYQSAIDTDVKPSRVDLFPNGFSLFKDYDNGAHVYKVTNIKKAIGFQTSLCEQFKNKDGSYSTGDLFCYSDQPSMQMQYFVTNISTLENFKTWMETNPLTMVYKTTQAEFIPLSESEQTQLRSLHSYSGTTNIMVDSGEVPCGIKLTYRKEI